MKKKTFSPTLPTFAHNEGYSVSAVRYKECFSLILFQCVTQCHPSRVSEYCWAFWGRRVCKNFDRGGNDNKVSIFKYFMPLFL